MGNVLNALIVLSFLPMIAQAGMEGYNWLFGDEEEGQPAPVPDAETGGESAQAAMFDPLGRYQMEKDKASAILSDNAARSALLQKPGVPQSEAATLQLLLGNEIGPGADMASRLRQPLAGGDAESISTLLFGDPNRLKQGLRGAPKVPQVAEAFGG